MENCMEGYNSHLIQSESFIPTASITKTYKIAHRKWIDWEIKKRMNDFVTWPKSMWKSKVKVKS